MSAARAPRWPSERAGRPPRRNLLVRRRRLPHSLLWGRTLAECRAAWQFLERPRPPIRGGSRLDLLTEAEAGRIRELARTPGVFWLDPEQRAVSVEIPSDDYFEHLVEARGWPGVKELDGRGLPTGYMREQEEHVQVLVVREIRSGRVVREWEDDFEQVPLWHFLDRACLGESRWRSKFAEHIPADV